MLIFVVKMSHKNLCVNFDEFLDKIAHLFFLKIEKLRNESVIFILLISKSIQPTLRNSYLLSINELMYILNDSIKYMKNYRTSL